MTQPKVSWLDKHATMATKVAAIAGILAGVVAGVMWLGNLATKQELALKADKSEQIKIEDRMNRHELSDASTLMRISNIEMLLTEVRNDQKSIMRQLGARSNGRDFGNAIPVKQDDTSTQRPSVLIVRKSKATIQSSNPLRSVSAPAQSAGGCHR